MEFLLLGNQVVPMSESRSCCSGGAPILPHLAAPARLQRRRPQHIKQSRIPDCSMFGPDWTGVREGGGGGMMDGCGGAIIQTGISVLPGRKQLSTGNWEPR